MPSREEEIAWAAGLFEGEGCLTRNNRVEPVARLNSTDEETPHRFSAVVRVGGVYGPYHQGGRRKAFWVWVACGWDALEVVDLLWPWLGERRRERARELFGSNLAHSAEGSRFHGETLS
jgi:hypothetical protein